MGDGFRVLSQQSDSDDMCKGSDMEQGRGDHDQSKGGKQQHGGSVYRGHTHAGVAPTERIGDDGDGSKGGRDDPTNDV